MPESVWGVHESLTSASALASASVVLLFGGSLMAVAGCGVGSGAASELKKTEDVSDRAVVEVELSVSAEDKEAASSSEARPTAG